jgi:hypothetical protein
MASREDINYIIYAPPYNENRGGPVVLHKLCHLLNQLGERSYIYPRKKNRSFISRLKRIFNSRFRGQTFTVNPDFNTPVAKQRHLKNSIIIYPEVTAGNPLGAKNVIRWFLHKPGYHTGKIEFGENELYFFYDKASDDSSINKNPDNQLFVVHLHPAYRNLGYERDGSCYLVRKGSDRSVIHNKKDSIQIDGLSHYEIAEIFNKKEIFYSYDEVTMYSQFAALCGCVSVVIPESFKNREEWVANHPIAKYGVAYGVDDQLHAKTTQGLLRNYFAEQELESLETVKQFIKTSKDFFIGRE